ncbi:hypothetical protein [Microbacterium sp. TWP3-1-2b2]|uniref:hypothetical protein n=1 Tax=Microbacterium sp. TWP3-1-2b2 TaxID=2804651 RepID=UPI003CF1EB43
MTYQPFLPEVASGSIEAPHVAVALRRHLRREVSLSYDVIVVTAGAVTRTLPVPGIAEVAFRLKHVEEAAAVRDEFLTALDRAADLPKGSARTSTDRHVRRGGFAGSSVWSSPKWWTGSSPADSLTIKVGLRS